MTAVTTGMWCFLIAAAVSILPLQRFRRYAYFISSAGALGFGFYALQILVDNPGKLISFPISSLLSFSFQTDALTGFFVLVISVISLAVSVYSIGYTRGMERAGQAGCLYNTFTLSMYAVVLSGNIITFLISWETMSLLSYFLVTINRDEESSSAGLLYAVMTHAGTACIIALFMLFYSQTGSMDFTEIRSAAQSIPAWLRNLIFVLSVLGFGTKAGIIPLHTWLPRAHPAAPSNVSALMSGVMIKTGIYGIVRINFDLLHAAPLWWGISILVIGAVSCILGVMYALMEHDIKRLLAYHSVENIGIILLGLGAALMLNSSGLPGAAALAFTAALYHTLNHAVFKGLLFLGAGSVMHATHTRNMEDMGGLLKAMPYTGLFFLVGSVSICALPPFNGFVSEWLTYHALLAGYNAASVTAKIVSPLCGAALAVTGALAAACFVKAFGISFLGLPRSSHSENVREAGAAMLTGMGFLAILCLVLGLFPGIALYIISPAASAYAGGTGRILSDSGFLHIANTFSTLSPAGIIFSILIMFLATIVFVYSTGGRGRVTTGDSWDCGIKALTPRMQYTATAFTKPLRIIFSRIYLPRKHISISYIVKPLFIRSMEYDSEITPFFEKYIYRPVMAFINAAASRIQVLQSGSLHLYLGYILATLIILLILGRR